MSEDYLHFLINKFRNDLEEAKKNYRSLPLYNHLQKITKLLPKGMFDPSHVKELKRRLLELNELLAECVTMAERRRQTEDATEGTVVVIEGAGLSFSAKERWSLIRVRIKLRGIKKILKACRRDIDEDKIVLSSSILVLKPEAFDYFQKSMIRGLEIQVQEIENKLFDNRIIGIVGMGGSGKTALARSVFHRTKVQNHFQLRLWIDLSEATDVNKEYFCILVEKLSGGYIRSPRQYGLDEVLSTLYSYIGDRRCLIVLDGVWHAKKGIQEFIDLISRGFDGAVIVTSRLLDVAKYLVAGHGYLHSIKPLDKEVCGSIFIDSVNKKLREISLSQFELHEMEEEIKCRCNGLPLAAKTLAEIISTLDWRDSEGRWRYATQSKRMLFEINVHDRLSLSKAWYRVIELPGINLERSLYRKNQFLVIGTCTPDDIALQLGRFCHVELISYRPEAYQDPPTVG